MEADAIKQLGNLLDEQFEKAILALSNSKGRIIISGIGKSAVIAQKIVATLNSTGSPAIFLHAADAIHGDIGMMQQEDIVIVISKSGESPEIKILVPLIKNFKNKSNFEQLKLKNIVNDILIKKNFFEDNKLIIKTMIFMFN